MSLFEFLMVLISIIIGLGVAEILTGIARVIRARATLRYYWVHGVLTTFVFLALIQQWWEAWELRALETWTFPALIGLMSGPIAIFLIAHVLFPESFAEEDMESYYYGPMRAVWILGIFAVFGSTLFRPIFTGGDLVSPENLSSLLGLMAFLALYRWSSRRLHAVVIPLTLVVFIWDVIAWTPEIAG